MSKHEFGDLFLSVFDGAPQHTNYDVGLLFADFELCGHRLISHNSLWIPHIIKAPFFKCKIFANIFCYMIISIELSLVWQKLD